MKAAGEARGVAGEALRQLRLRRRMTLDQFAQEAGISKGNLSEIERGVKSPTVRTLENVARALGLDLTIGFVKRRAK